MAHKSFKIDQGTIRSVAENVPPDLWGECFRNLACAFNEYSKIAFENDGNVEFGDDISQPIVWTSDGKDLVTFKGDDDGKT